MSRFFLFTGAVPVVFVDSSEQVTDQLERVIEQEQLQDSLTVRCMVSNQAFRS